MSVLDTFSLAGKSAIVTGASSGLGVAFAIALAEAGAHVTLGARRADKLQETARSVEARGGRAVTCAADVSRPEDCRALAAAAAAAFGKIDLLVNNAGVGHVAPATSDDPEDFQRVLTTNLSSFYWMAQACVEFMPVGSSIVNISSVHGLTRSDMPTAAYAASKAGVLGLTRDLSAQWGRRKGIRVNALVPGYFATPLMEAADATDDSFSEEVVQRRTVLRRLGDPAELVGALVFLASDAASYITGTTLIVDGGLTS